MYYYTLMYMHLFTVIPCVFLGAFVLLRKKGSRIHKKVGWVYMSLMVFTAIVTLFMPAYVGGRLFNHFGWIHLFSLMTLHAVPSAIIAIKKGNIRRHKSAMIQLYVGALIIAGAFTFMPGRYMHTLFFG